MENPDMKEIIKQCFANMYIIARAGVRKQFKDYKKRCKKFDVARDLVFLREVSENPDEHFAPEYTWDAWQERVRDYLDKHPDVFKDCKTEEERRKAIAVVRGSIVWDPEMFVLNTVSRIFQDSGLKAFCKSVQDFYYESFFGSQKVVVDKEGIINYADQIAKKAKAMYSKSGLEKRFGMMDRGGR